MATWQAPPSRTKSPNVIQGVGMKVEGIELASINVEMHLIWQVVQTMAGF